MSWRVPLITSGSVSATSSPFHDGTFAVTPVVDYEPPTQSVLCQQPSRSALRRPAPRAATGPASNQNAPVTGKVLSLSMRQAAVFADAALRRVLEVIDRRRPAAQLRPLLTPSLVDSVLSIGRASGQSAESDGAAVLRRIRLQPVGRDQPETAAEVFGTYSRGERIHAIACRVEQSPAMSEQRWLVVALHIG